MPVPRKNLIFTYLDPLLLPNKLKLAFLRQQPPKLQSMLKLCPYTIKNKCLDDISFLE